MLGTFTSNRFIFYLILCPMLWCALSNFPVNLRLINRNSTALQISWDYLNPETTATIEETVVQYRPVSEFTNSEWRKVTISGSIQRNALLTGLLKNTKYEILVIPYKTSNNKKIPGPNSSILYVMTDQDVPEVAPFDVVVIPLNTSAAKVEWDFAAHDAKVNGELRGFTIFFTDENVLSHQTKRQSVSASQRSWILDHLTPGGHYRIQVAATTIKGDGPKSKGAFVYIPESVAVPLPPSNFSVTFLQSNFILTWEHHSEASLPLSHFQLIIKVADTDEILLNDTLPSTCRNYSFEDARDNTAIRSLKLKPLSPTVVELSWFPPAKKLREELYKLTWQAADCSFQRCTVYEHNTSRSSYTINDLEPGKNYTIQIFAYFKELLRFGKSFNKTITMPDKTPPPPIIDSIDRYNATNMRIRLRKVDYPNIKSYTVYYIDAVEIGNENCTSWPRFESRQNSNSMENVEIEIPMLKPTSIYTLVVTSKSRIGGVVVEGSPSASCLVDIPRVSLMPLKYSDDIAVPWNLTVVAGNIQSTSVQLQFYFKNNRGILPADHLEIHYSGRQSYVDSLGYRQQYNDAGINNVTLRHPSVDPIYVWTLSGLVPNMPYVINVTAVAYRSNEKLYSHPVTTEVHTDFDVPPYIEVPFFIASNSNTRTITIGLKRSSSKNGPLDKYYIILQLLNLMTPYEIEDSFSFRDNLNQHQKIIGVFEPDRLPSEFIIGSESIFTELYSGKLLNYSNPKLNFSSKYRVKLCIQITTRSKQIISDCSAYSKVLSLNTNPRQFMQSLTDINYTVIWVICVILIIIVIAIVLVISVFQHRQGKKSSFVKPQPHYESQIIPNSPCMTDYQDVPLLTSQSALVSEDVRKMPYFTPGCLSHPPIPKTEFVGVVERLKANDNFKFSQEYESIDPGRQFSWESSLLDYNRPKNRYANVIAYEHSRVVLDYIDGVPGSDYINANFIDGYLKPLAYIATQGPLPNTIGDFWRMIWQVNCSTIVMMTKLEERNRLKCDQYWPSTGCEIYDKLQVALVDCTRFATFCARTFRIGWVNGSERHEIKHFQFTAWPDHGVPEHSTAFLMFLRRVKSTSVHDAGPVVVHCSAGVGRTGCFIVVDAMLDRLKHESTVDIYGYVTQARSQRNYMVQTEDQYIFIYDTVAEAISYGCSYAEIPLRSLYSHLQKMLSSTSSNELTEMEQEFKRLATMRASPSKFFNANLPANRFKNRLVNILPFESTRVILSTIRDQEGSDYINASFIDSYVHKQAYIATQSPLANTVSDFWRMIWECNCSIVVMLTKLKELGREKCHQYWPSQGSCNHDNLKVENIAEYNMQQYNLREFRLTDLKDGKCRTVRQFHYNDWPEQGVPQTADSFLELIIQVHKTKDQFGLEHGPIVIHCSAGVGRTGVFITLSIALERIRYDAVVDIFMTVKMLRTQRPAMVQTEDQYQFCYRAALEYINSFEQCDD